MQVKTWKEKWLWVIAILLFGAVLTACFIDFDRENALADGEQNKVHISFAAYGNARQKQIIEECARIFERDQNCVVDTYCFSTFEELNDRVISQYSVGEPFDVFISDINMMYLLADGGWLRPLDDIVEARRKAGDVYYPVALNYGKYAGEQLALPTGLKPYMLYFNSKMLSKNGMTSPIVRFQDKQWDFDSFVSYLRNYTKATSKPALAIDSSWPVLFGLAHEDEGFFSVSDNGSIALDAQIKDRLTLYQKLIAEGVVKYVATGERKTELSDIFRSEDVPIILGGIEYINKLYDAEWMEWDIVPLPSKDSNFGNCPLDIPLIAVSGGGLNTKLAADFADYYVSTFGQKLRLEMGEYQISSLDMTFYTSMGDVKFPAHSNYYMLAVSNGYGEPSMSGQNVLDWFDAVMKNEIEPHDNIFIRK